MIFVGQLVAEYLLIWVKFHYWPIRKQKKRKPTNHRPRNQKINLPFKSRHENITSGNLLLFVKLYDPFQREVMWMRLNMPDIQTDRLQKYESVYGNTMVLGTACPVTKWSKLQTLVTKQKICGHSPIKAWKTLILFH